MANPEQGRNFGEKTGDFFKRSGIIGAILGLITMLAEPVGATIFVGSVIVGGGGVAIEKLSGPKKK